MRYLRLAILAVRIGSFIQELRYGGVIALFRRRPKVGAQRLLPGPSDLHKGIGEQTKHQKTDDQNASSPS